MADIDSLPTQIDPEKLRQMQLLQLQQRPQPAAVEAPPMRPMGTHQMDRDLLQPVTPIKKVGGVEAPELGGVYDQKPEAPSGIQPVTPQSPVKHLSFAERQALPTISPGAPAGSAASDQAQLTKIADQKANPWGSPENHPGTLGKIGHVLGRIGNIAGNVVAGPEMALIPGTDLYKRGEERHLEKELGSAQQRETAEEAVRQRPEAAEAAGALKERLAREANESRETIAGKGNESKEKIAGEGNKSKEQIASEGNETKQDIATGRNKSQAEIAHERELSAERIATGHNLAMTEAARIRAANANDPNKLTNTMKTMKQQAQSTLPGIDRALDETEKVAGKLGPAAGRWNDFWQGKVGASDPEFAHYKDEVELVSSAVTLAHARGRMSKELYDHFNTMFDAGKQSPENMIQALNVAKEWLTEYAHMGEEPPVAAPGGPVKPNASTGNAPPSFKDWKKSQAGATP